ncbi:TetR family transcriptional regulator [Streptomyces corynorhini]|uniref:TetR/AcrR family transcriptional regulator n=1 Tax=Streptomyces corynorhini TaxID=2282652 RepID=A0A370B2X8_9ACTN|nr:TetR family transcriptional regulator [Streptomyces corynorhini]RDG33725.1 TetR/AcrR family transcriptional regulator [Streptomyces corynorhini]
MTTDADPASLPAPSAALTERQEARRRSILCAAVRLARRGGFDAVQMREVAEEAGVALGTLYRYFPSKVHLLVATLRDQLEQLHAALRERPPSGADAAERVGETLLRACHRIQRDPYLADAMFRALTFADRGVSDEVASVSRRMTAIVLEAMGPAVGPHGPTPQQLSAVRVVVHTWHAALISGLAGRTSGAEVRADVMTACRLIELTTPR